MNTIKSCTKYLIILSTLFIFSLININTGQSYYFWLKSSNNTPENIESIEKNFNVKFPIVSFIFDPRDENKVLDSIDRIVEKLWTDRIYHFTLSPNMYSANDVVSWKFDTKYNLFFEKIKEKNIHVIFRTMHEMNGWRYPRASNPEKFKAAWIHVRTLSRIAWLDEENVLFDFSVNHWDMPTKWTPSQTAPLIECNQSRHDCYHFEDYYPWNEYVDIVWFTFYNRWKAIWNRQWLTPTQILYDKNWNTYERLKSLNKPIIIDEVATTSVRYDGNYNFDRSRNEYLNHNERKNVRLHQLWEFLINRPEIVAALYFNTDFTHGLSFKVIWEADRAIINMEDNKVYNWFRDLELFWEKSLDNILSNLFHLKKYKIEWKDILISNKCNKELQTISSILNERTNTIDDKIAYIDKLQQTNMNSNCIKESLQKLKDLYKEIQEESYAQ